jgi:NAD(P)-dependent dehydrogenase (short-subunit alcohol dehydrogenase family)
MDDVLGYEGKRVVVTGCASGMGAEAARLLGELGAVVIGLDLRAGAVPVAEMHEIDLRSGSSIEAVAESIKGPIDAIFSVAGLPGSPFSDLDTVLVNFAGARHLIELLVPKMPAGSAIVCVASNAGLGWQQQIDTLLPIVSVDGFDALVAVLEANPDAIEGGYRPSKMLTNAWVAWRAASLLPSGIRLNCTNPGPTQTAMMSTFEEQAGKELIDAFAGPSGRRSTPTEQAWPLLFLNSPRSSYIAGEALHTDAGFLGAMVTGQLNVSMAPTDDATG